MIPYREFRCPSCHKLLFKGLLVDSEVEAKCRGCGKLILFKGTPKEELLCYKAGCAGRIRLADAKEKTAS